MSPSLSSVLAALNNSSNEIRTSAEEALKMWNPNQLLTDLMELIKSDPEISSRAMATVLLKRFALQNDKFAQLEPELRNKIQQDLVTILLQETSSVVANKVFLILKLF